MNFVLISLLAVAAAFTYLKYFSVKPEPALAKSHTVQFESVVPIAMGEEELVMEYDPTFDEDWENNKPVLIEEADTVLLLEAEKLITDVEEIVKSNQDVYTKLKQVIPGYMLLHRTEYYEPVNRYIQQAVQHSCGIELSEKELVALWS